MLLIFFGAMAAYVLGAVAFVVAPIVCLRSEETSDRERFALFACMAAEFPALLLNARSLFISFRDHGRNLTEQDYGLSWFALLGMVVGPVLFGWSFWSLSFRQAPARLNVARGLLLLGFLGASAISLVFIANTRH